MKVELTNKKDDESYIIEVLNYTEAKEWITKHLDLSKEWLVMDIGGRTR